MNPLATPPESRLLPATIALQLHAIGMWPTARLVAERDTTLTAPFAPYQTDLRVLSGPMPNYYVVRVISAEDSPIDGWITLRILLEINNMNLGVKPLSLYAGAVDDFHSGMARFTPAFPTTSSDREYFTGEHQEAGYNYPTWVLTARRTK